jgi:hypothetical protein
MLGRLKHWRVGQARGGDRVTVSLGEYQVVLGINLEGDGRVVMCDGRF